MPLRVLAALLCPTLAFAQQIPFSDAHVHLNAPAPWIEAMDHAGVDRAVILAGRRATNQDLLQAAARWPGRVLPFVSVGPEHPEFRPRWLADDPTLGTLVDSLVAGGGFWGIGEISVSHFSGAGFPEADFDPTGRAMQSLMSAARRHRVPILIHCEITRLQEFERLLTSFPDVTVVWAHGGYTPLVLAERLLAKYPNLIYELSARTWPHHPRSPDYTILRNGKEVWPEWVALIARFPTRFLVGTDAAGRSAAGDAERVASVQNLLAQLPDSARHLVARENLTRLLRQPRD